MTPLVVRSARTRPALATTGAVVVAAGIDALWKAAILPLAPVPVAVMAAVDLVDTGVVDIVIADVLRTAGFEAAVGESVAAEEIVGVSEPEFVLRFMEVVAGEVPTAIVEPTEGPAENWPTVNGAAALPAGLTD